MMQNLIVFGLVFGCALAGTLFEPRQNKERIIGGTAVAEAQYPHQASLRTNQNVHFCGGSIISSVWILTAAHCVTGKAPNDFQVVVGTNTLNAGGATHEVSEVIIHAFYEPTKKYDDIAVVRLATPIIFTHWALPTALASTPTPAGIQCWLSGWGLTSSSSIQFPNILQHISLSPISIKKCQEDLRGNPITTGHVCTSGLNGQGACDGDWGSPLICQGVQHGIASWGLLCAKGNPDVFTSVGYYRDWIKVNTGI